MATFFKKQNWLACPCNMPGKCSSYAKLGRAQAVPSWELPTEWTASFSLANAGLSCATVLSALAAVLLEIVLMAQHLGVWGRAGGLAKHVSILSVSWTAVLQLQPSAEL